MKRSAISRVARAGFCLLLGFLYAGSSGGAASTHASTASALKARVDAYLNPLVSSRQFGGVVLISHKGHVLVDKGYGMADEAHHRPNTANTTYQLFSLGKAFASMAILQLQERGKLKVSDHVCRYLPSCPASWQTITLHELLTHTSGIPDNCCPDGATTIGKTIAYLGSLPLLFKPGTAWAYTTVEYNLLGYVIERASGERYRSYIIHHILTPLHMTESGFMPTFLASANHAVGYGPSGAPLPQHAFKPGVDYPTALDSFAWGGGGLYSSIRDLRRWDGALSAPKLVSKASLRTMFKPWAKTGTPPSGPPYSSSYGYGWFIDRLLNRRLESHPGGGSAFWAYIMRFPDSGFSIIVLCNRPASAPRTVIMTHLAGLVFGHGGA